MKGLIVTFTQTRFLGVIDENKEIQEITTEEGELLEISKIEGIFKVTNGMDGYGHNTKRDYEQAVLLTTLNPIDLS